jgi:hypothetical protein
MSDAGDLVYDGRARKRPSGASDLTQRIYMALHDHPEGLTVDELHDLMREGWLETDYYRAYEQYLAKTRLYYQLRSPSRVKRANAPEPEPYGSGEFKRRAQRWAISKTLSTMRSKEQRTVRRDGDRWYKGERAPRITVHENKPHYRTDDWAAERRDAYRADTDARVRREQIRAELFAALADKRIKGHTREVIQHAYDYLCGF